MEIHGDMVGPDTPNGATDFRWHAALPVGRGHGGP